MLQVCYNAGCGVVFGQKEPLSDRTLTHGLCPKHYAMSLQELKADLEKLRNRIGGFKVLIVEDSTLFRQLFKETLHKRFPSIEIHEAGDGEEAFHKIETFLPDLIFMDIRLPGVNGIDLTRKVKARFPNTIVAILTGFDLPEYREVSRQTADYFFSKDSLVTENLFAVLQSILPVPA